MKGILFLAVLLISGCAMKEVENGQLKVEPNHKDGVYSKGETVEWTIELNKDTVLDSLHYEIWPNQFSVSEQAPLELKNHKAVVTYTFNEPGTALLKVGYKNEKGEVVYKCGGAIANPDDIQLSSEKPADFDAFWKEKVAELKQVPINAQLTKDSCIMEGVEHYKITMDNIRGTHINGQLVKPEKGEKLPALLVVQWAGVYPLEQEWVVNYAKQGWLVLNINPHDLPIDNPKEFYDAQFENELKEYWMIGNDDKNESYFLRMYLSCYQAAEYLTTRDDWDGKTLVVTGTSQGGMQAVMTAGLYPGITACLALVPAGFDMLGPEVERKGGWPQWYNCGYGRAQGRDLNKIRETSRYYDVANFVPNIKCPVFVGVGLIDETCPAAGIFAGLNQLKKNKEIMILVNSPHQDVEGSQVPYNERRDKIWLDGIRKGEQPWKK